MKVSKIYIKDYNQFKEFTLDLTYPAGHEKAGQPLDKVCFIGQSGTGKTSLLLALRDSFAEMRLSQLARLLNRSHTGVSNILKRIGFQIENNPNTKISIHVASLLARENEFKELKSTFSYAQLDYLPEKKMAAGYLYYPAMLDKKIFENNSEKDVGKLWSLVGDNIQKYQENEIQKRLELSRILEENPDSQKIEAALQEFNSWKQNTPSPLRKLADKLLDKVLKKFNLRVRTELSFEKKDDIGFIKIETLQGKEVPEQAWSTGTKQIIMSALPLYSLQPKNYLILVDEPERSLYPDIQTEIVNILTSKELSTDCQFFFATHSPLIASSFEPWEIVELKFNDEGSVYRELYYEGENHVDNYTINPQLLRWDGILQRVFDLDKASNPKRNEALSQLARLKKILERKTLTPEERAVKWKEYSDLAEKLNWDIEELDKPGTNAKN